MNKTDKEYFENIFWAVDQRLDLLHDDVLIIKTERKMEKKFTVAIAGAIAFVVTTLTGLFWR